MKKMVISIVILSLLVFLGLITAIIMPSLSGKATVSNLYKIVNKVNYDDVLSKDGNQLYYYYQETCAHCKELKPTIVRFYNAIEESGADLELNIVDMGDSNNEDGWYDWQSHGEKYGEDSNDPKDNPDYKYEAKDLKTIDDIKITGTPSIIYVKDGEVKRFEIGDNVSKLLEELTKEYNL